MNQNQLLMSFPDATPEEKNYLLQISNGWSDEQLQNFTIAYGGARKKSETILITALLGFVVAAGIHRFVLGQIGMGLLYLFTGGLCLVGTIIDLINHKKLTTEHNNGKAREIMIQLGYGMNTPSAGNIAPPPTQ
jgi:TM2 domain-containing membrane protein YozV